MTAVELLDELRARGVELVPAGDRIRFRPASKVPPELLARLRERKAEVLFLLRARHAFSVPLPDPETSREVCGPAPSPGDLEALRHELAGALWELRECQAGREPWGSPILVRGRPLADWLPLDEVARILRGVDRDGRG